MNTPGKTELRVVSEKSAPDDGRATLRIDADRPVPAPPPSAQEALAQQLANAQRELDRLNLAVNTEQGSLGQHMNWLLASQAILIHTFLMVFVVSAMGVIAVNHWLLGGLALIGITCALVLHASLDRGSQTLAILVLQRRAFEAELANLCGRTPTLPKDSPKHSAWAAPLFVVVWLGLLVCSAALRL